MSFVLCICKLDFRIYYKARSSSLLCHLFHFCRRRIPFVRLRVAIRSQLVRKSFTFSCKACLAWCFGFFLANDDEPLLALAFVLTPPVFLSIESPALAFLAFNWLPACLPSGFLPFGAASLSTISVPTVYSRELIVIV
jgi:hypothetical protein